MSFARSLRIAVLACLVAAVGCGDDASDTKDAGGKKPRDAGTKDAGPKKDAGKKDAGDEVDAAIDAGPEDAGSKPGTYVLSVVTFGPEKAHTNVIVVDSLDISELDSTQGMELPGQANITTYGGKLFVSDGEKPEVTRYQLNADGNLEKDGTLSFMEQSDVVVSVDPNVNTFISPTKAYLSGISGKTVVWNPEAMSISGTISVELNWGPEITDNMSLVGSSGFARGNRLYRTFFWFDWKTYDVSDTQYFAVFNTDDDTVLSTKSETRCPALGAPVVADEKGVLYFSNWFNSLSGTLRKNKPSGCALRLPADSDELDADWTLNFKDLTKGLEGAQLSYTRSSRGVFAAFHKEDIEIKNDDSGYDVVTSPHWEAWTIDLAKQTAKPIEGIKGISSQQTVMTLEGRTFLFSPNQDVNLTKVFEVKSDGTSREAFQIQGFSRGFLKLK